MVASSSGKQLGPTSAKQSFHKVKETNYSLPPLPCNAGEKAIEKIKNHCGLALGNITPVLT